MTAPLVPLHILTGFLGSGKTTILAALLRATDSPRIAALVNDVAELPLDAALLAEVDEDVLTLASGCVCCTLRDDLHAAVARVLARRPERIVLETTGLADPAPLVHALSTDPRLRPLVRPAGVCAVVDALRAEELLATEPEAGRQVEFADRIALTKGDLAPQRVPEMRTLLARHAPGCDVREAVHGAVDPAWLLDGPPLARLRDAGAARAWLHGTSAGPRAETHTVSLEAAADPEVLHLWLRLVTQLDGPRLLRVKVLFEDARGDAFVLQSAGSSVSPPRRLAARPAGLRGLRMVLVARGLGPGPTANLLASLRSAVEGTPALT